jgi:WD40 repeat protein
MCATSMTSGSPPRRAKSKALASWDAVLGIDAVEALPVERCHEPGHEQVAAVATYALGDNGLRQGRLYAVRASRADDAWALDRVATVDALPGLLDIQAAGGQNPFVLAACADGTVRGFPVRTEGADGYTLEEAWTKDLGAGKAAIMLSVDCESSGCDGLEPAQMVCVSDSLGGLHLLRVTTTGCVRVDGVDCAHKAEAWTCCVGTGMGANADGGVQVWSGGDDGVLCGWDLRAGGAAAVCVRGAHGGVGVTSVGLGVENALLTGGYDDVLRAWDVRAMGRGCSATAELGVGGGVWRVRRGGDGGRRLLVACMYDGFKVVRWRDDGRLAVVDEYRGHAESGLAYGAAWLPECGAGGSDGEAVALTGSFYDHSLQLWSTSAETPGHER